MIATGGNEWRDLLCSIPGYDPFRGADDFSFDQKAAGDAILFIEKFLTRTDQSGSVEKFTLERWQKAVVANIYGWKHRETGRRRYKEVLIFVPRKNGKTALAACLICIALYMTAGQTRCYSSAAEREQAKLVFEDVAQMIRTEPVLNERATIYQHAIVVGTNNYKALSAEAGTKHGLRPDVVINDELHAHRTANLTNALLTGMAIKGRQPLFIHLTTSDYEREGSICNDKHAYAGKVRDGVIDDPAFLPVIYEATKDDDWTDEAVWAKANPNLDVSVSLEYLRRECQRAQDDPTYENTFKRLHLNIRTEQAERLLPIERWDACRVDELPDLTGQRCWCGLDLGATGDFTAFVAVFPVEGRYAVVPTFWIPEAAANRRKNALGEVYRTWERAGALKVTPGNEVDYAKVRADIAAFASRHPVQHVAVDRLFQGAEFCQSLNKQHGIDVVDHGQGFLGMAIPTRTFLEMVGNGTIMHDGNPVLRWMVSNLTGEQDAAGNWKPSKKKSGEKIDGVVATIMGIGLAVAEHGKTPARSFYEDHAMEFTS